MASTVAAKNRAKQWVMTEGGRERLKAVVDKLEWLLRENRQSDVRISRWSALEPESVTISARLFPESEDGFGADKGTREWDAYLGISGLIDSFVVYGGSDGSTRLRLGLNGVYIEITEDFDEWDLVIGHTTAEQDVKWSAWYRARLEPEPLSRR